MNFLRSKFTVLYYSLHLIQMFVNRILFNFLTSILYLFPGVKKRMNVKFGIKDYSGFQKYIADRRMYRHDRQFHYGIMLIVVWSILLLIGFYANQFFKIGLGFGIAEAVILIIASAMLIYFAVTKNDRHLYHFEKFDYWSQKRKIKNVFISIAFIFLLFWFLIYSINR